jgi:hypothetical protein
MKQLGITLDPVVKFVGSATVHEVDRLIRLIDSSKTSRRARILLTQDRSAVPRFCLELLPSAAFTRDNRLDGGKL